MDSFDNSNVDECSASKSWYDIVLEEEDHHETDLPLPNSTYPIIPNSSSNEPPRPSSLDFEFAPFTDQEPFQPLTSTPRRSHPNRSRNLANSRQSSPSSSGASRKENVSPVSSRNVTPNGGRRTRHDQQRRRSPTNQTARDVNTSRASRSPIRRPLGERQTPNNQRKSSWAELISGRSPRPEPHCTASRASPSAASPMSLERDLEQDFCRTTSPVTTAPSRQTDVLNDTEIDLDLSCGFDDSMCLTDETPASGGSPSPARIPQMGVKRTLSSHSRDDSLLRSSKRPCYSPTLEDPHRLAQRQKQIDFGKKTVGYEVYIKSVPRRERVTGMPRTPEKRLNCSKRQFDGLLKSWRKKLHTYDPDFVATKTPSCSFDDMSDSALGNSVATDSEELCDSQVEAFTRSYSAPAPAVHPFPAEAVPQKLVC